MSEENRRETSEEDILFSYDVLCPLLRSPGEMSNNNNLTWNVLEKGNNPSPRYEISMPCISSGQNDFNFIRGHTHRVLKVLSEADYHISILTDLTFSLRYSNDFPVEDSDEDSNEDVDTANIFKILELTVKTYGVLYTLKEMKKMIQKNSCKGVIAISTGSFAFILCYFGNKYKVPVTVVMPTSVDVEKVKLCKGLNFATVHVKGNDMVEAHRFALHIAQTEGLAYIDGNDHPYMIIGQAILGLDIASNGYGLNYDVALLPTNVANCGLTAGIAYAIKGSEPHQVIEVRTRIPDPLTEMIREETLAKSELEIPVNEYNVCTSLENGCFDKIIEVDDGLVPIAVEILRETDDIDNYYLAIGVAGILSGQLEELKGKRILILDYGDVDSIEDLTTNDANRVLQFNSSDSDTVSTTE
ncbi:PREDICTED: threo-3-hydroxyaspartate ammonia-lyase-like [Vollenhovia emeryi]|uniref:threo-3-hydroxyaspartate ammonia-lyase-like n=1 Tax=Vollenhovia emeryi TaxID=411798 RepID=UPI0005F4F4E4|nr:PREDICTED: threo-3-hydroxyaspartate ammonia-lyase-like [Vollenhovia emeryi]